MTDLARYPMRLVTEADTAPSRENIAAIAQGADLTTQLLCSAVLSLMDEVKGLRAKVKELSFMVSA